MSTKQAEGAAPPGSSGLAVIPARGGSKRIPRKNIKPFRGSPLIAYSIKAALASALFARVIVSTDDEEIAAVARGYGAEVPFMREAALADDYTGTLEVTQDAWRRLAAQGFRADFVACIYATAPLLTADYLRRAYARFVASGAAHLYGCCEFPFPIQRARYLDEHGRATPVQPECMAMRSQDLPRTYQDAGQFYFYTAACLEGDERGGIYGFELPRHRVIDIDTPEDFNYAQMLCQVVEQLGLP